jgi:hypothetical protein
MKHPVSILQQINLARHSHREFGHSLANKIHQQDFKDWNETALAPGISHKFDGDGILTPFDH